MSRSATVEQTATVKEVDLPASIRERCTLEHVDYADAFLLEGVPDRTPQQWARAMLEDAPLAMRAQLVTGWTLLGIRLGPPWSDRTVLGWPVHSASDDAVLLAAGSLLGLGGNLALERAPGGVVFSTMISLRGPVAPRVWPAIETQHRRVVRSLLLSAARRERSRAT